MSENGLSELKRLYLKAVELFRARVPLLDILELLKLDAEKLGEALRWAANERPQLSPAEELTLSLEAKKAIIARLNKRLREINGGVKEVTDKYDGEELKEHVESTKYNLTAEAALWKLIREYERDIDELNGRLLEVIQPSTEQKNEFSWKFLDADDREEEI